MTGTCISSPAPKGWHFHPGVYEVTLPGQCSGSLIKATRQPQTLLSLEPHQSRRGLLRALARSRCRLACRALELDTAGDACGQSWVMPTAVNQGDVSKHPSSCWPSAPSERCRAQLATSPLLFFHLHQKICKRVGFLLSQLSLLPGFCFKSTETAPEQAIYLVTRKSLKLFQFSCKILDNLI